MYISTPPIPEVENFQTKIYYPAGDRTPDPLNQRQTCYLNISKTKAMVIGRKPKNIDIRIKGESIEQVDSFKYLGCNISSNMTCCQEVKQKIAMAKEVFNRKRNIFCGPLEKELRKRLVKCSVWSVVLYGAETWTL